MRTAFLLLAVASWVTLSGCKLTNGSNGTNEATVYRYTAYDSTGTAVVEGELSLNYVEADPEASHPYEIEGRWDLERASEPAENIGPQTGTGNLVGRVYEDDRIRINLNPNWNDNNIMLEGAFTDERFGDIEGQWKYFTFAGEANGGQFEADR